MKTCEELAKRWDSCKGGQILVDHTHLLKMYLNVNANGNKELLVPVNKAITSFRKTEAIDVNNYKYGSGYLFSIELLSEALTKEYVCLCFDLIESSRNYSSVSDASKAFFETFKKWYSLWNSVKKDTLSLIEIRGLMGELKYISEGIDEGRDSNSIISAWTIHKDASRDFIYDTTWDEIKTVQSSSDYITISSLEQLEHTADGRLVVYKLDRVDSEADGSTYTLNGLVEEVKSKLDAHLETEFVKKLMAKGYTYNQAYDIYVFKLNNKSCYIVDDLFPRISKDSVPDAISAARYDILLSRIEKWREENGEK